MRRNVFRQMRDARARALAEGTAAPVAFWWDDPELTTKDGDVFELWFNDMIDDWFGISAAMIVEATIQADGRDMLIHMDSPGGMVTDALSIHSTLRQYSGKITTRIEGMAASAASFVMLAADEIIIDPAAMIMIHDAWDITMGPAIEHRRVADLLDRISNSIAGMYQAKAGETVEYWREEMTKNGDIGTWYIGAEAVDAKLVDRVSDEDAADDATAGASVARWGGVFGRNLRTDEVRTPATAALTAAALVDAAPAIATAITTPKNLGQPAAPAAVDQQTAANWSTFLTGLKGVRS